MRLIILAACCLSLGGCSALLGRSRQGPTDLNVPLVQATDQSVGSLSVTTCFVGPNGQQGLEIMLQTLTSHGVLVRAENGGTARLNLNACPANVDGDLIRATGEAVRNAAERRRATR